MSKIRTDEYGFKTFAPKEKTEGITWDWSAPATSQNDALEAMENEILELLRGITYNGGCPATTTTTTTTTTSDEPCCGPCGC